MKTLKNILPSKWLQFLTIQDEEQTHRVVLQEKEQPPKKGKFTIYCLEEEEQERTYKIKRGRKVVDTLNLKERKKVVSWIGVAEWREMGNVFYIETTCRTFEGGFLVLSELTDNMRWAVLPESWTYSQPNYKKLKERNVSGRSSFLSKIFKRKQAQEMAHNY